MKALIKKLNLNEECFGLILCFWFELIVDEETRAGTGYFAGEVLPFAVSHLDIN